MSPDGFDPGNTGDLESIYAMLARIDRRWDVAIGVPSGPGWIAGVDLADARSGPFNDLLRRIGEHSRTGNRLTIAASFALRFGWSSAIAIGPYVGFGCVPDISLENLSFKFTPSTFLEQVAMHTPRGVVVEEDRLAAPPSMAARADAPPALAALRRALIGQAQPVVDALHGWSGFSRLATWGQLTSSWAAQFTAFSDPRGDQRTMLPVIEAFFAGTDAVTKMQPWMYTVRAGTAVHLYHRRASCCRWYLLPQGDLCTSCPLVPHDERLRRNRAFMEQQLGGVVPRRGHDS